MANNFKKAILLITIVLVFALPNFVNAGNGADVNFDILPGIEPKILPLNGQLPIRLGLTIRLGEFSSFCGSSTTSSFKWSIYHDSGRNGPGIDDIQIGSEKTVSFSRDQAVITKTINDTITVQDSGVGRTGDFAYAIYAWIECPNGTNVTSSSVVNVRAGSGDLIFTCVAPLSGHPDFHVFSCSPNNTNNCSDNPSCTGKPCFQVRVSFCGDPAPPPGSTGSQKFACNSNNQCVASSTGTFTTSNCDNRCSSTGGTSSQSQSFSFEIPNPLRGGADDLTGLIKVLAQWLFNIAIPIAVIMIIYSGVLFLTAQGNPGQVTKAKDVLKYAVIGLAIMFIGSGFVSLIQSILELGNSSPPPGQQQLPNPSGSNQTPALGVVGNQCSRDRDCISGLRCQDSICKRATGNLETEPCNSGRNCDVGLTCDKSDGGLQVIDGQTLGTCAASGISGGRIGDVCERDSNCISGLKCNTICQRREGNLEGESCVRTASTSNCQSRACLTTGSNTVGTCTTNPTQ